ncbi:MAG: CidA/LrgA family protein [Lachnospiraceae bacterium]|nr:CidA/LrgA family protein [Lachnospiraceae bacterium]
MKYVKQFAIIALMTFLGECLNLLLPLPVPASIYGMILLFLSLQTGILKLSQIEETADLLLAVMPIFFISPTVSLMSSIGVIKDSLVGVLVICLLSTIIVMAVTGLVSQAIIRHDKKKKEVQE